MNKKATEELALRKIIGLIILALVLIGAIILISRQSAIDWLNNLPSFVREGDSSLELNEDQLKALNYFVLGKIKRDTSDTYLWGAYGVKIGLDFFKNHPIDKTLIESPIYWKAESDGNGKLFAKINDKEEQVGISRSFFFDLSILKENYNLFAGLCNQQPFLENKDFLSKLDKAKFKDGFIYRSNSNVPGKAFDEGLKCGTAIQLIQWSSQEVVFAGSNTPQGAFYYKSVSPGENIARGSSANPPQERIYQLPKEFFKLQQNQAVYLRLLDNPALSQDVFFVYQQKSLFGLFTDVSKLKIGVLKDSKLSVLGNNPRVKSLLTSQIIFTCPNSQSDTLCSTNINFPDLSQAFAQTA